MDLYGVIRYTDPMNKEEIQELADLSRLSLTEDEITSYQKDFEGILSYINTLNTVEVDETMNSHRLPNTNYLRSDEAAYQPGQFSEDILAQAPERKEDFIKVAKIL